VYDHEVEEVEALGREEFLARQWESIFAGYWSKSGIRKTGRRWADLFEVGLDCSQGIADWLVQVQLIDRADRDLENAGDAIALMSAMIDVIAGARADLLELLEGSELGDAPPGLSASMLERHDQLLTFLRINAFGEA
jgi:hypothetical protein